jgi:long-chain-fatty-acid---luciferin-component ligase
MSAKLYDVIHTDLPAVDLVDSVISGDHARLDGGERIFVVTGGGWKNREAELIERREFDARVQAAYGISGTMHIRDVFNQVELGRADMLSQRIHVG